MGQERASVKEGVTEGCVRRPSLQERAPCVAAGQQLL